MKLLKEIGSILIEFFEIVFVCVFVFIVIQFFVGQLLEVVGDSMLPNFNDKEQLVAEKVSIKFEALKRGEVVIFHHPQEQDRLLIKRVIGLSGETIKISKGKVYINGQPITEDYLPSGTMTPSKEMLSENSDFKIPNDSYIVLGDNRSNSSDSRDWGPVKLDLIVGRGFLIYYPFNKFKFIN